MFFGNGTSAPHMTLENGHHNSPISSVHPTGLWGTTLTENTAENRELYVKTTLRELLVYIVFLVDICLCKWLSYLMGACLHPAWEE